MWASTSLAVISTIFLALTPTLSISARTTNPNKKPPNAVLLSSVSTLTLRANQLTASRRVPPVSQLSCTGPKHICKLHTPDVIRCVNAGSDYDKENVQWTCTANLPPEFKLGSTDVTCEGYESSEDPYVLKGSCGVEYRLLLTELGEEKHGQRSWLTINQHHSGTIPISDEWANKIVLFVFWAIFIAVIGIILWNVFFGQNQNNAPGGGGGGGGDGGGHDPPPPYSYRAPPKPRTAPYASRASQAGASQDNPWRPGFWMGALGGAAGGYWAGRRQRQREYEEWNRPAPRSSWFGGGGGGEPSRYYADPGVGSSRSPATSFPTSHYESTGFGSTRRR